MLSKGVQLKKDLQREICHFDGSQEKVTKNCRFSLEIILAKLCFVLLYFRRYQLQISMVNAVFKPVSLE